MEKYLSFQQKLDIVLSLKGLTIKDIERELEKDGTIYKAYNENREPSRKVLVEMLRKFHIRESWWQRPNGDTEAAVFEQNITSVPKSSDSSETPLGDKSLGIKMGDAFEGNSIYRLVPTSVLQNTVLIPEPVLRELIRAKDEMISELKDRIAMMERLWPVTPQTNKE